MAWHGMHRTGGRIHVVKDAQYSDRSRSGLLREADRFSDPSPVWEQKNMGLVQTGIRGMVSFRLAMTSLFI